MGRKRNKKIFDVVGTTSDGLVVVSGILGFEETYGLPLEDILISLKDRNMIPSWIHIILEAKKQNRNMKSFMVKLKDVASCVFGKEYWSVISPRLDTVNNED